MRRPRPPRAPLPRPGDDLVKIYEAAWRVWFADLRQDETSDQAEAEAHRYALRAVAIHARLDELTELGRQGFPQQREIELRRRRRAMYDERIFEVEETHRW